jgi:hypothetical protein
MLIIAGFISLLVWLPFYDSIAANLDIGPYGGILLLAFGLFALFFVGLMIAAAVHIFRSGVNV